MAVINIVVDDELVPTLERWAVANGTTIADQAGGLVNSHLSGIYREELVTFVRNRGVAQLAPLKGVKDAVEADEAAAAAALEEPKI